MKMNKFLSVSLGVGSHMALLAIFLLSSSLVARGLRSTPGNSMGLGHLSGNKNEYPEEAAKEGLRWDMLPRGSSLPDCSHACGPCTPCKRVMLSFQCSVAESCPIVYRCMCKGRYYQVPSN